MKTNIHAVVFLCVAAVSIFAAEPEAKEKKDPIDAVMDKAIDKDPSTAGMVQATDAAARKWEAELNSVYAKLKKAMSKEEWEALVISQRAWLDYREKETKAQQEIFTRMEGTMWVPVSAHEQLELVKSRVLVLRGYLSIIQER